MSKSYSILFHSKETVGTSNSMDKGTGPRICAPTIFVDAPQTGIASGSGRAKALCQDSRVLDHRASVHGGY